MLVHMKEDNKKGSQWYLINMVIIKSFIDLLYSNPKHNFAIEI